MEKIDFEKYREEAFFDFSIHMPRLLIGGRTAVLDNVRRVLLAEETACIADCGRRTVILNGSGLSVREIGDERLMVTGSFSSVEFYEKDR